MIVFLFVYTNLVLAQDILQISQATGLSNHLDQRVLRFQTIVNDLIGRKKKAIVSIPTITELKGVTDGYAMFLVHPVYTGTRTNIYSNCKQQNIKHVRYLKKN